MGHRKRIAITLAALLFLLGVACVVETWPDTFLPVEADPVDDFLIVAYRGASSEAPENTMAAFRRAVVLGANAIECDVMFTKDDEPVIAHHDDLSDRVPREQRPAVISTLTLAEVKALDVGAWFAESFRGERVPTLLEALEFFRGKLDRVYLHNKRETDYTGAKTARIGAFAEAIRRAGMVDAVVVMVEEVALFRELAPDIQLILWAGRSRHHKHTLQDAYDAGVRHFCLYHSRSQLPPLGRTLSKLGLRDLGAWLSFWPTRSVIDDYRQRGCDFTVNDPFLMKLYLREGTRAIGTDDPALLRRVLDASGGD